MKVTISKNDLTLVLDAIAAYERLWRESKSQQIVPSATVDCEKMATNLHALHADLSVQLNQATKIPTPSQSIDPFDAHRGSMKCWDPNDPRNW